MMDANGTGGRRATHLAPMGRRARGLATACLARACLATAWLAPGCLALAAGPAGAQTPAPAPARSADVALIVSIDVSESVDEDRYRLQMDGIASALEDPGVISTITSGPAGRMLFAMVVWADKSEVAVPWTVISGKAEAIAVANIVRHLKRYGGEFTCLARMFRNLPDLIIADLPMKPSRLVIDVSGDGVDNCSTDETTSQARDGLVKSGVTINGLPIIEEPGRIVGAGAYRAPGSPIGVLRPLETQDQVTLDEWYRRYVMGGEFAFILPANGYADFARAMRQKFVTEISSLPYGSGDGTGGGIQPSGGDRRLARLADR